MLGGGVRRSEGGLREPVRCPLGLSLSSFNAVDEVWRQFQSGAIKDLPTAQQEVMRVARETIGQ